MIPDERAIAFLFLAVAEKGEDYRDGKFCQYARNGKPSCIIGHALFYAGVPIWALEAYDSLPASSIRTLWIDRPEITRLLSLKTKEIYAMVQGLQDDGCPWGEAVKKTLDRLVTHTVVSETTETVPKER